MIGPETRAEWKARTFMERYSAGGPVPQVPQGAVSGRMVVRVPPMRAALLPREDGKKGFAELYDWLYENGKI